MKEQKQQMLDWLGEIISHKPWNEDNLTDWANQWFGLDYDNDYHEQLEREAQKAHEQGLSRIATLKPQVVPYQHDLALPALPDEPDGQLHGIGFIYDEDRDDRVLVAIDDLKANSGIVALAEHEGGLVVYTRLPIGESSINVCGDEWVVEEFVPFQGRWEEVTSTFMRKCVAQVLGQQ
jgi:hypothetical protein